VDVDSGRVDSCHGHFCASDDRSGHTERKDSWNDDCSPDAHDSSVTIPQVSDRVLRLCPILGSFNVKWSIVGFWPFHASLQSLSQKF
jgi:hypothetical protein